MYGKSLMNGLEHCYQQIYIKRQPKYVIGGTLETTGHLKELKFYGGGGPVRGLCYKRFSSATCINGNSCARLEELINLNKNNTKHINHKLIHLLSDTNFLILAYEGIKSKPGNSTKGSDSKALDGINLNWFTTTSEQLKAGKYVFKPARRVSIPKAGSKTAKRVLTTSSPKDKIVQHAIYLILNAIYEPTFLQCSHGSRPNKGSHTALKDLKFKFQGVKWCTEGDILCNFPSIDHKILLSILSERIKCSKFLSIIKKCLKAGFKKNNKFLESNKGLFQGSITSPILNNIYLHQLDLFLDVEAKSFFKGKNRAKSPDYRRLSYQIEKAARDIPKLKKLRNER